ncbi:MAG: FdtA/QdtA family cupin domain-containing protein [Bacteroidota bacterium]
MTTTKIKDIVHIKIPKIEDRRGNLSVIEKECIPFKMKRVYYLYDIPSGAYRGGHSHKEQQEFLIAVSGSFNVILNDGVTKKTILLNRPDEGLLIPSGIWRELDNFSSGAVCLALASGEFEEADYIRDFQTFLTTKRG